MTERDDEQANYAANVWGVFRSLWQGRAVYRVQTANGPALWVNPERQGHYYEEKKVVDPLLLDGLVEESLTNFPPRFVAEVEYVLTDKGRSLVASLDAKAKEVFIASVDLSQPE